MYHISTATLKQLFLKSKYMLNHMQKVNFSVNGKRRIHHYLIMDCYWLFLSNTQLNNTLLQLIYNCVSKKLIIINFFDF